MKTDISCSRFSACALLLLIGGLCLTEPAFAQGGLSSVNTFMQTVVDLLKGAGILIVTIAIMWCGYKMIFKGASFSEVAMIFVGGLLIGGAATIAGYMIPA